MVRQPSLLRSSLVRALPFVILGALPAGCVVSSANNSRYVEREEKRFSVDGKPDVKLLTRDGSIEIRSWDRQEVQVVVEKRAFSKQGAAAIEVTSSQDGNRVSVEVKLPRENGEKLFGLFWGGNARLIVSLPATSNIQALTGDGSIDLEGVSGEISLRSGDGSIRARRASGTVAARSGDGSIRLDDVNGAIEANTSDGSIGVTGALTALRARSGDGSIAIHARDGSTTGADWDVSSGDGSLVVEVPEGFGAELDARTGDGGIHLDGVTLSNVAGDFSRNHRNGRMGDGGRAMRLRTGDGSITVRRISAR